MRYVAVLAIAVGLSGATPRGAAAQESTGPVGRAAVDGIEVLTGVMDYDLSGTGKTVPFAVGISKALSRGFAAEFNLTVASPAQQFGPSWMYVPEGRLSYAWRFGRVRPYLSGGAGSALVQSNVLGTRWRLSVSGGGGARLFLNDQTYAMGEMRLRGISQDFSSTTTEWVGGIGWAWR